MKKKRVKELPPCDFRNLSPVEEMCSLFAKYDAPTESGSWANMCEAHYKMHKALLADELGFEFIEGVATPKKDSTVLRGIEPGLDDIEYWENALFNDREVKCPNCEVERRVEGDADYIFNCEGCGIRVKCPTPPM